eukprot:UN17283
MKDSALLKYLILMFLVVLVGILVFYPPDHIGPRPLISLVQNANRRRELDSLYDWTVEKGCRGSTTRVRSLDR